MAIGIVATTLAACSSGPRVEAPRPGDALEPGTARVTRVKLPPRQEIVVLARALRNAANAPVEITKLRARPGEGIPESVQIVQTAVVINDDRLSPGTYVTFPPVGRDDGRCVTADVRAGRGVTVAPGDEPLVLVWLRAVADGAATVDGVRVTYELNETPYTQSVRPAGGLVELDVTSNARTLDTSRDERACAHRTRILPGSITI